MPPVLSLSLGDTCVFRYGGTERRGPTKSLKLESGDALVLGGAARLAFHGVDRILARLLDAAQRGRPVQPHATPGDGRAALGGRMMEVRAGLPVLGFEDRPAFEAWLAAQPADATGGVDQVRQERQQDAQLLQGRRDRCRAVPRLDRRTASQIRRHASWLVRFTPRKPRSKWSEINRTRALQLIETGQMKETGLVQVDAARQDGRWEAAYAPASTAEIPTDLQQALDKSPTAAAFFATLTGANRYAILYRIGAVKTPTTRARKIAAYIAMLERGETLRD